jgi:hypothetical protein
MVSTIVFFNFSFLSQSTILLFFHGSLYWNTWCHNPSLGLVTKARVCKVASQERSIGITYSAPGSAKECEGMNPHTPKWTPILGIKVPMDFWIFKGWLQGSKPIDLKNFLYHWIKLLKRRCLKWARMTHLDIWNTSYGQKKGRELNW